MSGDEQKFNPEEANLLIRSRRTVKPPQYDGRVIDREIVAEILENANWAPTHGLRRPWRFKIYSGVALKRLSDFLPQLYLDTTPEEKRKAGKTEKLAANPLAASHVIAIIMNPDVSGKIPEVEDIEAVACAVQNMQLSARAYGIGSFWSTGAMTYAAGARDFFELEADDQYLGLLYLGYPKHFFPPGAREPVSDRVEWIDS